MHYLNKIYKITGADAEATAKYKALIEEAKLAIKKINLHLENYGTQIEGFGPSLEETNNLNGSKVIVEDILEQLDQI